jgi:hypothetical protein
MKQAKHLRKSFILLLVFASLLPLFSSAQIIHQRDVDAAIFGARDNAAGGNMLGHVGRALVPAFVNHHFSYLAMA